MNRLIPFVIFFTMISVSCRRHDDPVALPPGAGMPAPKNTAEAIEQLDRVIASMGDIDRAKRQRIDSLKRRCDSAPSAASRFKALEDLSGEYRSYSMDTLLYIARECVREAYLAHDDSLLYSAYIMEAEGYKGIGNYTEAIATLEKIPPRWRAKFHRRILNRYCSIYYSLSDHSLSPEELEHNQAALDAYRDSIIMLAVPGSPDYWLNMSARDYARGDYHASLADLDSLVACENHYVDPGVLAFQRARSLEETGQIDAAKYNYAVAAAYDLSKSVRKYEALQELARILSDEGDDKRAYKYIMQAIHDIQASNARSRLDRIAGYMPIITATYTEAQQVSGRNKTWMLLLAGVLIAALGVAVAYALRTNKRLSLERRILHQKNIELENLRLRLSDTNRLLQESAKVKEQYLGYVFNMCADYIGSLEKYRLQMSQRIKAGKVKDITAALALPQGTDHLQSFFKKFDSVFLDIFPDFIEKFNALLQDDFQLTPRPDELLSPELRIYALVRLGINDSNQIATFLHYSTQTVYNYRFKVRSHARIPREDFVNAVKAL